MVFVKRNMHQNPSNPNFLPTKLKKIKNFFFIIFSSFFSTTKLDSSQLTSFCVCPSSQQRQEKEKKLQLTKFIMMHFYIVLFPIFYCSGVMRWFCIFSTVQTFFNHSEHSESLKCLMDDENEGFFFLNSEMCIDFHLWAVS